MAQTLRMPNGTICHVRPEMRSFAKYLRWEIFKKQRYLRPGFELRPTDNVVDVGGNIGLFVLWAAPQVPQGRIITLEPNPSALASLSLNVQKNALSNVTVIGAALGAHDGTMELAYEPGYELFAYNAALGTPWFYTGGILPRLSRWVATRITRLEARAPSRCTKVLQVSLARVFQETGIDVINYMKLDCEGSEFEILKNLEPQHLARVERIALEYHLGPQRRLPDLISILEGNGFEVELERGVAQTFTRHVARFGALWARNRARS